MKNDGLGIGLALSRQLAQLNGGTLTAESAGEGRGVTFTLSMPTGAGVPASTSDGRAVEALVDRSSPTPSPRAGLRIVVEDNDDSAEMMSVWLEQLGHEVRVARTGPDGVALIMGRRPGAC